MTDSVSLQILRSVIGNFEARLLPLLNDDSSKIYGGIIAHALKVLEARLSTLESADAEREVERVEWLKALDSHASTGDAKEVGAWTPRFTALLGDAMMEEGARPRALALLMRSVDIETRFLASLDENCLGGSGDSYRGGRNEGRQAAPAQASIDAASLARWARAKWPEADGAEISDVKLMPGGFSKTTAFFALHDAASERRFVVRRDLPVPMMGKKVVDEFPLLSRLYEAGFPVARPYAVEASVDYIGGAFMVSERLQGSVDFNAWKGDRASVESIVREFAATLARLHSRDTAEMISSNGGESSAYSCMADEIERWYSLYRRKARSVQPLLEFAFAWLRSNIPEDLKSRRPSMLHGDAGFHNLLVHEGSISALLDWEFHHWGDPIEELNYARQFIEQVIPWEDFMGYYREAGGVAYPADDNFFAVWTATRNPAGCIDSVALFETELPDQLQLAVAGYLFGPRLQVAAARKVIASVEGATEPMHV